MQQLENVSNNRNLCVGHSLVALVAASAACCGLVVGRVYLSGTLAFGMMIPNLVLAWMPYLFSAWVAGLHRRQPGHWWQLLLPGGLWLLFFPNAPYLATEFVHLYQRGGFPLWYDVGLVFSFAWTGFFLAVASLRAMEAVVASLAGKWMGRLFVVGVAGLTGLGIYLGRFLRWNSWDALLQPRAVLADVVAPLLAPMEHPRAVGVTLLFAALLLLCYLSFTSMVADEARTRSART
jgi:uncharacterized membrane protein